MTYRFSFSLIPTKKNRWTIWSVVLLLEMLFINEPDTILWIVYVYVHCMKMKFHFTIFGLNYLLLINVYVLVESNMQKSIGKWKCWITLDMRVFSTFQCFRDIWQILFLRQGTRHDIRPTVVIQTIHRSSMHLHFSEIQFWCGCRELLLRYTINHELQKLNPYLLVIFHHFFHIHI